MKKQELLNKLYNMKNGEKLIMNIWECKESVTMDLQVKNLIEERNCNVKRLNRIRTVNRVLTSIPLLRDTKKVMSVVISNSKEIMYIQYCIDKVDREIDRKNNWIKLINKGSVLNG